MARCWEEKVEESSAGQEFVLCIGRGLVRADGRESFCLMLVGSVGRSGEMAGQGRRNLTGPGGRRRRRRGRRRGRCWWNGL